MTHDSSPRLSVEMIPATVFGENLRNRLTAGEWNKCKKYAKEQSGGVCAVCGGTGARGIVHCHENWEWIAIGKSRIQRLTGLVALCPRCHGAKHYGRAQIVGYADDAEEQLMAVNGWSRRELNAHLQKARAQWIERSKHHWEFDLSWLADQLGIVLRSPVESAYSKQESKERGEPSRPEWMSRWTRSELEFAGEVAKSMRTTKARILDLFLPKSRMDEAAARGISVEEYVDFLFAQERLFDELDARKLRGEGPEVPLDPRFAADLELYRNTPEPLPKKPRSSK
ncbi:hypothetical protein [Sinomonas susongensis]|uniref:hypothetical protein n=1 Tax=Sinomonas susongensis TaxID=1324851 RepID=UPI0011098734|nr:hypothetical protein [Sinomonas susongensis]